MKLRLLLASLGLAPFAALGQVPIASGHVDIGVAYENRAWDLHVHDEIHGLEYEPGDAVFRLDLNTLTAVPAGSQFAFLGAAGAPLWVLPNVEAPGRIFLGFGAEELTPGDWNGSLRLQLKSVRGPGFFYLWDTDSLGRPVVQMNSHPVTGAGVEAQDFVEVVPGSHADLNWAFSAPGHYVLGFEASGTHRQDGFTASGPAEFHFEVIPEPGVVSLALVGGVAAWLGWRRRL